LRPYHGSILKIRNSYKAVFPEPEFNAIDENEGSNDCIDSSKIFKIKYSVNLIPSVGFYIGDNREYMHTECQLFDKLSSSEELEMFATEPIMHYAKFKWDNVSGRHHSALAIYHFFYIFIMAFYTNFVYNNDGMLKHGDV